MTRPFHSIRSCLIALTWGLQTPGHAFCLSLLTPVPPAMLCLPEVCAILWSTNSKEFISGHGFAQNQLVVWKYPTMVKVTELNGHTARVLNLTMSPDGSMVASASADAMLQLWCCFEMHPVKKKEKEKAGTAKSSIIHQGIR
ncbi:PREDICTED: cell division cycle protein 20 homolog [Gavialis gangeticus]|uniref:cell division cycle protein 20 homolog n=1 Tax=Gavialis gangeticus TaxID=94835 RepID=UPI00092FAE8E|nr:PREDICTED: cell division cycle protein 20 homolog [Gavialis gangeticus]